MNHESSVFKKVLLSLTIIELIVLLCTSCGKISFKEPKPKWFNHYRTYSNKAYEQFITHFLDTVSDGQFPHQATLFQYYLSHNYEPIWTVNGFQEHKIALLLQYLSEAPSHGIPLSYFNYDTIIHSIDLLKNHQIANDTSLFQHLWHLETLLSSSYMKYAQALQYGATDPKTANGGKWLYEYEQADSSFFINVLEKSHHLEKTLKSFQPNDTSYLRLQEELNRLQALPDSLFDPIPQMTIQKGQRNQGVIALCRRLHLTGELSEEIAETSVLSDAVLAALNLFRANNAIPESDTLDRESIDKLNRPLSYYQKRLAANMERLRWKVVPQKGENHIAVNIPDFTLQAFREGKRVFKTRVCCGKTQSSATTAGRIRNGITKAFKSETPLLHSEIGRIVLNPEWNVPYDIIKDEYYPKLCRSNTAVIHREHLYLRDTRTGRQVIPDSIDWNQVSQKNIPYRIYQSSGSYNALGRIKFDFPNTESVYLHDTNNKGAFKRRVRALSHGCVRVENPFELAAILYEFNEFDTIRTEQLGILVGEEPRTEKGEKYLEDLQKRDSIQYANLTDQEKIFYRKLKPTSVSLKNKMPVYIEYYTCFVGDNDCIQYREDIYYKDDNIINLMK